MEKKAYFLLPTLLFAVGCTAPSPEMKSELNNVSPAATGKVKEKGFIQNGLDEWLQNEWEPLTSKDSNETNISSNNVSNSSSITKERFKLQDYVDKWNDYQDARKEQPKEPSHLEKVEEMPVIGQ